MRKRRGPVAKFGARYGRTLRKRYAEIEIEMRKKHKCPRCETRCVKRVSVGIWRCRKCGYTFAGGAYIPFTSIGAIRPKQIERK